MICNNHDEIMKICRNIEKLKADDFNDSESLLDEIKSMTNDIYNLAYDSKKMGQKMEDRLTDYRKSIEGLGFIRNK